MTNQSQNKQRSKSLQTKSELLTFMFQYINEGTLILDDGYQIMFVNEAVEFLTGYSENELKGKNISILLANSKNQEALEQLFNSKSKKDGWKGKVYKVCKNGTHIEVWCTIRPIIDSKEKVTNYLAIFSEISYQRSSKSQLQLANKVIENTSEGVMVTDLDGKILSVNPAFSAVTGYKREEVIGELPSILQSGVHDRQFYQIMWDQIIYEGNWSGEIWNKRKDGTIYPEWLTISAVKDKGIITNFVAVFSDISEKKRSEERLKKLVHYDVLTGVANRYFFNERLKEFIEKSGIRNQQIGILFLDLDRFKIINDTLGYHIGDLLLQGVANRLRGCLRKKDLIARLGGDEFAVILPYIADRNEATAIACRIMEILKEPFFFEGHEIFISTSIGISLFPFDGNDVETLLKKADLAMVQAKENGRNNYAFYCEEKHIFNEKNMKLENLLRKAIKREEFCVFYQPQINLKTKEICGMEALIRWCQPEIGMISPGEFIPLAEETGLIIEIGEWILRKSLADLKILHQKGFRNLRLAVNISAIQFQQVNFIGLLEQVIKDVGIDPRFIELELTESVIMPKAKETNVKLVLLKQLGVKLSIDDFGTGYSSLSYLSRFPIDTLKIDQSFIRNLLKSQEDTSIVTAILMMAHSLNIKVVAEGVESKKHLQYLIKENCDMVQGFFISKPINFEDLIDLLESWSPMFID